MPCWLAVPYRTRPRTMIQPSSCGRITINIFSSTPFGSFTATAGSVLAVACLVGAAVLYPLVKVPVTRPPVMAPSPSDEEGPAVLNTLLGNVYRSFDFRGEEDVYDKLATSVHGDLLSEIYLQNRKSLEVTQAGGAQARVKEVEILEVDAVSVGCGSLVMVFRAQWTAMGTVGHCGHIHIRKNQYDANITVEPVDGAWKITRLEILEEKRIDQYAGQQPPPG